MTFLRKDKVTINEHLPVFLSKESELAINTQGC